MYYYNLQSSDNKPICWYLSYQDQNVYVQALNSKTHQLIQPIPVYDSPPKGASYVRQFDPNAGPSDQNYLLNCQNIPEIVRSLVANVSGELDDKYVTKTDFKKYMIPTIVMIIILVLIVIFMILKK